MAWNIEEYSVTLRLTQKWLGTVPTQSSIWTEHIATKQSKGMKKDGLSEEEIEQRLADTLEGVQEIDELKSGLTSFLKDEQGYYVEGYVLKGYFKNAARQLKQWGALKQLQSKVTNYLFIAQRKVYVATPDAQLLLVERPIRCETAQGPRTAIARSEAVPEGTEVSFTVQLLHGVIPLTLLRELLDYGQYQGVGQWRTGNCGTFDVVSCE